MQILRNKSNNNKISVYHNGGIITSVTNETLIESTKKSIKIDNIETPTCATAKDD